MKSQKNIVFLCICLFLSCLLSGLIFICIFSINSDIDATDISRSFTAGSPALTPIGDEGTENSKDLIAKLQWYDTIEAALKNDELIIEEKGYQEVYERNDAKEITRVVSGDTLIIFYMPTYTNEEKEAQKKSEMAPMFVYIQLKMSGTQISQPYFIGCEVYNMNYYYKLVGAQRNFDCDDAFIWYVIEKAASDLLVEKENRIPLYFGIWENKEEIESLTVSGRKPEIVYVESGDDLYYFWYFDDVEWINEKLRDVNWEDYTYRQIIDLLEITYTKTEGS